MQLAQLMQQEKEKAEKVEEARRIVLETLVSKANLCITCYILKLIC